MKNRAAVKWANPNWYFEKKKMGPSR